MINCSDRAAKVTVLFFQQVKLFWKMSRGKECFHGKLHPVIQ